MRSRPNVYVLDQPAQEWLEGRIEDAGVVVRGRAVGLGVLMLRVHRPTLFHRTGSSARPTTDRQQCRGIPVEPTTHP